MQVYGTTWKELIQEEFGDGIKLTLSGKFLPYKEY